MAFSVLFYKEKWDSNLLFPIIVIIELLKTKKEKKENKTSEME